MTKIKILIMFYLVLLSNQIFSQAIEPQFDKVNFNGGENSGTVYCVFKDKQGFLWLGTSKGLVKYDGEKIKTYRYDPRDSLSISSNEVWSIKEDNNGDLWIGTINKGINKFLRREEKFLRYNRTQAADYHLKDDIIPALLFAGDNELWACVWGVGLALFDKQLNKFIYFTSDDTTDNTDLFVRSIFQSENDADILWIGTRNGLKKFDKKTKKYLPVKQSNNFAESAASGFIFSMAAGENNTIWIASQNKGFCNYDPVTENISPFGFNSKTSTLSIISDKENNVWIGTAGDGLFYFDSRRKLLSNFTKKENSSYSLQSNNISSLFICDENILWVGSAGAGLSRYISTKNKFVLFSPKNKLTGFSNENYISHIFEDDDNELWLCGADGKIFIYNIKKDMIRPLFIESSLRPERKIYSVISLGSNKYLIASFGEGFFVYDKKSKFIIHKKLYPDHSDLWRANRVTSFLKISDKKYFIGTDGAGLFEFDIGKDELKLYNDQMPYLWSLIRDKSENIWIGTWGNGLFRLRKSSNELENYYPDKSDLNSFGSTTAVQIVQDSKGNLWIGTQGDGVFFLDKEKFDNPKFVNFRSSHEIPGDIIMGIVADDKDNIWISTQAGIARFNYLTNSFTSYGQEDGIRQIEFNLSAILKSSDRNIYFGSLEGLYYTNNKLYQDMTSDYNVVITDIKLFNNPIKFYNKHYPSTEYETINLNFNQNFISFEFTPLNFADPKRVELEYMLEGVDASWIYDEGRRFANYTDLSSGEFKFLVRVKNSDTTFNKLHASINIVINPPFWETWWAYSIYVIAFLSGFAFIRATEIKRRHRKMEEKLRREREAALLREAKLKAITIEQEKELEKQKIRNRIAQDLHDEIGSNLSSISLMSELVQKDGKINPDAFEKINRINKVAKGSTQAMRDIVWITNPSSDNIKDLFSKMNEVANDMLGAMKWKLDFPQNLSEINLLPETKRNVFFIYKEALNNILKHSDAENVEIKLTISENNLFLAINDDGKGFNTDASFTGNGLKNLQSRAKEINGILKLNSSAGKGTILSLEVKITRMRD